MKKSRKDIQHDYYVKNKRALYLKTRAYRYTRRGRLLWTYLNMKKRVQGRDPRKKHLYAGLSILPKEEFIKWGLSHTEYNRLFDEWELSGYSPKLRPSIDRIDTRHGYDIDNMQWLTLSANSTKAGLSRYHGVYASI